MVFETIESFNQRKLLDDFSSKVNIYMKAKEDEERLQEEQDRILAEELERTNKLMQDKKKKKRRKTLN